MSHEARALQARAEGRTDDAIDAWRDALRTCPDDWRLALELKRDLKAAFHYPDSDPLFRRAARGLPDAEWIAHYSGLYAFHGSDLDAIEARADAIGGQHPENGAVLAILGEVARQRRDWDLAESMFAAALDFDPAADTDRDWALKMAQARRYQRAVTALSEADVFGRDYAVFCLNLDRNPERWVEITRQFAGFAPPLLRIAGVEGSRLDPAEVLRRTGRADAPRGTLGCFMSHAAAWQAVLDRGLEDALIIEDDVIPLLDLPAQLGPLNLPAGYDVCFVNDRLDPQRAGAGLLPVTLLQAMQAFPPTDNAPGGDGYVLSRSGAERLLRWVAEDGYAEDVDWRLVAYGLRPEEVAMLDAASHAASVLPGLQAMIGRADRLDAFVLSPALIRTVGVSSDREDQNRLAEGRR